ncbi:DUF2243 domain-containing protein [Blastococcus montanus]|uniref:DUF2243 domain-containing protein n=1 Tax=Blastococcus montanus TaxID=3144973 RepID=UPI003209A51F
MPTRATGLLYGLGFGGFVDGIVLHQILQWHHMVSDVDGWAPTTLAGLEINTLADGFFHVATWVLAFAGTVTAVVSWRRGRLAPNWSFHLGLVLVGWGLFNLVEGLVDHQILGIHHVRDDLGGPLVWDLGFLASGVLLIAVGWLLHRRGAAPLAGRADASRPGPHGRDR